MRQKPRSDLQVRMRFFRDSVPHYPEEDSKLRATSLQVRRGGNCPNTLEVLGQLLQLYRKRGESDGASNSGLRGHYGVGPDIVTPYLISCLPSEGSPATSRIVESFGGSSGEGEGEELVNLTRCIYRPVENAASSYIMRSEATGSRTLVNYNDLAEMTADEFVGAVGDLITGGGDDVWFHFEVGVSIHILQTTSGRQ